MRIAELRNPVEDVERILLAHGCTVNDRGARAVFSYFLRREEDMLDKIDEVGTTEALHTVLEAYRAEYVAPMERKPLWKKKP